MKNIVCSILIILLFLVGCHRNKNIRQEFYPSGQLKYEVGITNDLRHGTETEYYEDGSIKMRGTRVDDKEVGFYYYYNMNQQIDSVIEYVPINIDDPMESFFFNENNEHDKNFKAINRYIIYKNGEIDYEGSVYFDVYLEKDTVLLGDTIRGIIDFMHQRNNQQNHVIVYIKPEKDDFFTFEYEVKYEENEQFIALGFNFVPKTKGLQTLKGMIVEDLPTEKTRLLFFEKSYYVVR